MPKINELTSPIRTAEFQRPEVYEYGLRVGSSDSWLTNYLPFKWVGGVNNYDYGLLNYENQADTRYSNQGTINALGHFAADLGVKTLSGIPSLVGGLTSLATGIINSAQVTNPDRHFSDAFNHNVFNDIAETMSMWGSETFPTFQQGGFDQMSFLEQIKRPGQYATSMVESIGFALQSFGIAGLLGKVGAGSRLLSQLAKGKSYKQVLGEISPDKLGKMAAAFDERMLNVFLSTNESAIEALDAREAVRKELLTARANEKNSLTNQEIDDAADNALNNVFWLNMATTSATNGFFTKLVRPMLGPKLSKTRANDLALEMLEGKNGLIREKGTNMNSFTKFLLDKTNAPGMVTKSILGQIGTEGLLEENLQFSIQKVNDASNINRTFLESTKDYLYNMATEGITFWKDEDRLKAVGAGGIIGGGMAVASNVPFLPLGGGAYKEAIDLKNRRVNALTNLNKSYTDFFNAGIVQREDDIKGKLYSAKDENGGTEYIDNRNGTVEKITAEEYAQRASTYGVDKEGNYSIPGSVKVDADGVPLKDQNRATTFAAAVKYHAELDNLLDLESAKENPDPNKVKLYQLSKLANLAQTAFETGTTDILLKKLDTFKNIKQEELAEYGIEDPSQIEQTIEQWKTHVQRLEANYIQTQDSIIAPVSSQEDLKILSAQKSFAADIGARITNMYTLVDDIDNQLNEEVRKSTDPVKALEIRMAFETDAAAIPSMGKKFSIEDAKATSKIAKLAAQKKDLNNAIEELGATYDKLINPKDGFSTFKKSVNKKDFSPYVTSRLGASELALNESTTDSQINEFVNKRASVKKQLDRLRIARSVFFSELVPQALIEYANLKDSESQDSYSRAEAIENQAHTLKLLINKVLEDKIALRQEDANILTSFIVDFDKKLAAREAEITAIFQLNSVMAGTIEEGDVGVDAEGNEIELYPLEEELYTYQTSVRTEIIPELLNNIGDTIRRINERVESFDLTKAEDTFKEEIVDEILQSISRIIDVTRYDGEKIDPLYDDLEAVRRQLKFAQILQEKAINTSSKNELYSKKAPALSDIIEKLLAIESLVKQNIANKELKNQKEDLHYAEAAISFKPYLGQAPAKKKSDNEKKKDTEAKIQKLEEDKQRELKDFDATAPSIPTTLEELQKVTFEEEMSALVKIQDELAFTGARELTEKEQEEQDKIIAQVKAKYAPLEAALNELERRRQEELKNINTGLTDTRSILVVSESGDDATVGNVAKIGVGNDTKISLTSEEKKEVKKQFRLYNDGDLTTLEFNAWRNNFSDKVLNRVKVEINAKYDAELAALKGQSELLVQSEEEKKKREKQRQDIIDSYDSRIKQLKATGDEPTVVQDIKDLDLEVLISTDPITGSMALMDLLAENKNAIDQIRMDLGKELSDLISKIDVLKRAGFGGGVLPADTEQRIKASPIRGILEVLKLVESKEGASGSGKNLKALADFNEVYDVVMFKENVGSLKLETDVKIISKLVDLHAKFVMLEQISDASSSQFNHVDFLNKVKEYNVNNKNTSPIPSSSQIRVVRELTTFLNGKAVPDGELFENGAALKAPAGAGKSLVVSKLFKSVANLKTDEIITAAPYKLASDNIAQSMGDIKKAKTVDQIVKDLRSKSIPKETKIIIIDEAGALDFQALNDFADAIASYNRSSGRPPVKFVFLYDPNQTTTANLAGAAIDYSYVPTIVNGESAYHTSDPVNKKKYKQGKVKSGITNSTALFIENLKQISPLSATYRSSISEIVDLQNLYKTKDVVSSNPSASSIDPKQKVESIYGTFSERGSSIMETVRMSLTQNPARTRVVIVGNEEKKTAYKNALPNVEVVLASESAGITRDEVYVDIEVKDNSIFSGKSAKVFNQWMYTALSRAKLYLHVANATGPTHIVDSKIEPVPPSPSLYDEAIAKLDEMIAKISAVTENVYTNTDEVAPPKKEEPKKPEPKKEEPKEPEPTPEEKPKESQTPPTEPPPAEPPAEPKKAKKKKKKKEEEVEPGPVETEPGNGGVITSDPRIIPVKNNYYQTKTVTKTIFEDRDENSVLSPLKPGDAAIVVKDITVPPGASPQTRFIVLKQQDTGLYEQLTILNDSELDDFEEAFGVALNELTPYRLERGNAPNTFRFADITGEPDGVRLFVQPTTQKMEYIYGPEYEEFEVNKDSLEVEKMPLFEKVLNDIYGGKPQDYIQDYAGALENWKNHVIVTKFKSDADIKSVFPNMDPTSLSKVEKGVPYLIIRGLKSFNNNVINAQFIKLTPRVLDSTVDNVEPIVEFVQNLIRFEQVLLESKLPGVYSDLRAGKEVRINNESFFPFHAFVTKLSDLKEMAAKGANVDELKLTLTKNKTLLNSFPEIMYKDIPTELLELAVSLDVAVHGIPEQGEKREGTGQAQQIMNEIGRQNLIVTTPSGYNLILRSEKAGSVGGEVVWTTSGMNLLGPIKWEREKGRSYNPSIPEDLVATLRKYSLELQRRGLGNSERYAFVRSILDTPVNRHLAPPSSDQLADLFINGKDENGVYSKVSLGFGLRAPIPKSFNYNENITIDSVDLSLVRSNLHMVVPDKLILGTEKDMVEPAEREVIPAERNVRKPSIKATIQSKKVDNPEQLFSIANFTPKAIEAFIKEMDAENFDDAFYKYKDNLKQNNAYSTSTKLIIQTLQSLGPRPLTTAEEVWQDLILSIDVKDTARYNLMGTASRDFTRGAILVRALGINDINKVRKIADFVRSYNNKLDDEQYLQRLENLIEKVEADPDFVVANIQGYIEAYNAFLSGLGFSERIPQIEDITEVRNALENVAEVGHIFRKAVRDGLISIKGGYTPIQIREVEPIQTVEEEPVLGTNEKVDVEQVSPEDLARLASYIDKANKLLGFLEKNKTGQINAFVSKKENAEFMQVLANSMEAGETVQENLYEIIERFLEANKLEKSKMFLTEEYGEVLDNDQVRKLVDLYTGGTPMSFFRRLLGKDATSELYNIVAYNKLVNSQGQNVWGLYKDGVMSFAQLATGGVSSKVVRHEIFHKIFWEYLTGAEQVAALNLAKDKYGELDLVALEERMAEDFEEFVAKKKPSFFTRLWNKIKRLLGFTYNNMKSLDEFFNLIENNAFSSKLRSPLVERNSQNIRAKYGSYQNYAIIENILLSTFHELDTNRRKAAKKGKNFVVLSYPEIITASLSRVLEVARNPSAYLPEGTPAAEVERVRTILNKFVKDEKAIQKTVNTYFGNINTRGSIMNFLLEKQLLEKQDLQDKLAELREFTKDLNQDGDLSPEERGYFEQIEEAEATLVGIDKEDFDVQLVDPTEKLTGAIKQRLVTIPYWKNGKQDFADVNRAFSIIVPRIAGLPNVNAYDSIEILIKNFSEFGARTYEKPNIRQAVGKFMYNMLVGIQNKLNDPKLITNVTFRKDATNDGLYAIYSTDKSDVRGLTTEDVKREPQRYKIEVLGERTMEEFVKDLSSTSKVNALQREIAEAYFLFEDLDFVKSTIAAVGSLRLHKGIGFTESFHYGDYRINEYAIQMGGGRRAHETTLETALARYINKRFQEENQQPKELFPEELYAVINAARKGGKVTFTKANGETVEKGFTKTQALTYFLKSIGVNRTVEGAPQEMTEAAFARLEKALVALQVDYVRAQTENESEDEYLENKSGQSLVDRESGLMYSLSALINTHYTLGETFSYTRGDGKTAYGWIDASWQTEVLTAIDKAVNEPNQPNKTFSNFSINEKGQIETTDIFLKNNIFAVSKNKRSLNRMKGFKDHDSIKYKGNTKWAKTIRKENSKDFKKRHFVANFVKRLSITGDSYYQSLPIPSNRRSVQNVEVRGLKENQLEEALRDIITAQKTRPDPNKNERLANNKNYLKNWKKFKFAGLKGNVDNLTTSAAVDKVMEHVDAKVEKMIKDFISENGNPPKVRIPIVDLERAGKALGISVPKRPTVRSAENMLEYNNKRNEAIRKIYKNFYLNYAVNQYSLSQILYGDETFYSSKEDETKRIQIATATGDTNLVDPIYGIPPTSRVLVVEDIEKQIPEELLDAQAAAYGETFDASDAAGFVLPEFYEKIAASYGTEALTDVVLKPVYFAVIDGVPTAIKYHLFTLTDSVVNKFPHLKSYRDSMRKAKADQMVFRSAVKLGAPLEAAVLDDSTGFMDTKSVKDSAIITIDNRYLRFQLNPASDVDGSVKNMSQGTAFINTNGQNTAEAYDLYKANAFIIENGLRNVSRELRLTRKGSLTASSEALLRKKLINLLDGLPGGRDVYEMLTLKHNNMEASLNLPLIAERVVSMISSTMSKATTGFRFPGSKLVLEPDLAPVKIWNPKTNKYEVRHLKYRNEEGYCEVLLPEIYREFVEKNNGIIGFRIPSTNYHSLLPLKVVGFIEASPGSEGNVIIAPSAIVYYHGSDYDVDTLFVIKKESYDKDEPLDLNDIISSIDNEHIYNPQLKIEKGDFAGYLEDKELYFNGKKMYEYLEHYIVELHKKVDTIISKELVTLKDPKKRKAAYERIKELNAKIDTLSKTAEIAAKNSIVHSFSENMRNEKNRKDLLTPIDFRPTIGNRATIKKELEDKLIVTKQAKKEKKRKAFLEELAKSGLIKYNCN